MPSVIQSVKPYFSESDIEKGGRWESDISNELNDSNIGIICLTKENRNKPWILFEAGALSKNRNTSLTCTLLYGIKSAELESPLSMFQATQFEKQDVKKLVGTINKAGGDSKLDDDRLDEAFEQWWGELKTQVETNLVNCQTTEKNVSRTKRDILEEILELTRSMVHSRRKHYDDSQNRRSDRTQFLSEPYEAPQKTLRRIIEEEVHRVIDQVQDDSEKTDKKPY